MSRQYSQSPRSSNATYGSSPDPGFLTDLKSPLGSSPFQPRYGKPGSTPHPNGQFWMNSKHNNSQQKRYYQQNNSQNKFNLTPRGSGRGGGYFRGGGRGGGHHRDPPPGDVRLYANRSMFSDPWMELNELLKKRVTIAAARDNIKSNDATPINSLNTTIESNDDVLEDQSLQTSDSSLNTPNQTVADEPVSSPSKT